MLGANWELAGGKWSERTGSERMGVSENEWRKRGREESYGAVSYMQIVFIVYDDFFHPAPSLLFLFIEMAALIRSRKKKENH